MLAISAAGTPRPLRAGPSELHRRSAGEFPALPKWRPRRACAKGPLPLLRRGRRSAAGAAPGRRRSRGGRGGRGWTLPMRRLRRVRSGPPPPRWPQRKGALPTCGGAGARPAGRPPARPRRHLPEPLALSRAGRVRGESVRRHPLRQSPAAGGPRGTAEAVVSSWLPPGLVLTTG